MNLIKPQHNLRFPTELEPKGLEPTGLAPTVPLASLQASQWFKLICGASYQHLPTIRSLAIVYALAGADCIDIAADPAIVATLREAIVQVQRLVPQAQAKGFSPNPNPWLMVSLNDGEDPHFRKAEFDPNQCPSDCPRPCERICPAQAIVFNTKPSSIEPSGVIDALCYGCGRCLPICPIGQINARSYVYRPEVVAPMVLQSGVDAVEIHTQIGRLADFKRLWQAIAPWAEQLKLIAISCPDGEDLIEYLWAIYDHIAPLSCALIWQTDGRPMSGDIGDGATRACIKLGQKVLAAGLPGFVQLAGGTNAHTVTKARSIGLLPAPGQASANQLAGIAYGSYARALLQPILHQLETMTYLNSPHEHLEDHPEILWAAVAQADQLTSQLKMPQPKITPLESRSF